MFDWSIFFEHYNIYHVRVKMTMPLLDVVVFLAVVVDVVVGSVVEASVVVVVVVDVVAGGCEAVELTIPSSIGSVVCGNSEYVVKSSVLLSTIPSTSSDVVAITFVDVVDIVGGVDDAFGVEAINRLVEVDLVSGVVPRP